MRIVVVGAGALGGMVGARLAEAGEDVTLIEINQARVKLLAETGLFISDGITAERSVPVRVVASIEGPPAADLIFVSVKSYQTEAAIRGVMSVIGPETRLLSMQNGIGNAEVMARLVGPERVLCGITYHSIQHIGPNRLRYRPGIKPIQIAPFDGKITPEVEAVGEVFRRAGLATEVVGNIDHTVWQKLLHNAVVNPVSAITGLTCRELLDDEDLQAFMRAACMEIVAVMRARGVPVVDEEDPYRPVMASQRALGKNRPSMWQDLSRGFRTEVDAINGAIVDEAERRGLSAPLNWGLVRFLHSRERQVLRRKERASETLEVTRKAVKAVPARPTGRAPFGGMPEGRVPLESAPRLKEMVRAYYRDLDEASRDSKRYIAWCSSLGPVEIVRALGFTPYFPENHSALIGASRHASRYISRAMAEGFSPFVSTAMTADIGATLLGESPLVSVHGVAGPPRPDVMVYSTNNGQSVLQWFEYYANRFGVPLAGLHPPAVLGEIDQVDVDSTVRQTLRLVERLEAAVGTRLDIDRLAEVVGYSARAAALWAQVVELATHVPSPLTYFDMLIHMAPMLLMRGTPEAVEYYLILRAELEQRLERGIAAVPGERFRVFWQGPPIWCALRPLATLFLERQVAVVGSRYTAMFALEGLDPANPIESMARSYAGIFTNRSRDYKADLLRSEFEKLGVDAVVYHDGRTCLEHSDVRYGLHLRLRRTTGLPSLVLEADTHDERLFSTSLIERQLLEFIEEREHSESRAPR